MHDSKRSPSIDKLCNAAIENEASDLHLVVGSRPILRHKGDLVNLETEILRPEDTRAAFSGLASAAGGDALQNELTSLGMVDFDFSIDPPKGGPKRTFRVHAANEDKGICLTLRLFQERIPTPQEIGLTPAVIEIKKRPQGLFLVTGATASGKSTTLASILQDAANTEGPAITCIEQPIEYRIKARLEAPVSIVRQIDVPRHVQSFGASLRGVLRQDPDIIMVGELRDHETIETAIHAAETGHLVMATVHTNSAKETIERIVGIFSPEKQEQIKTMLGASLIGIMSQKLLKRRDGTGRVLVFELLLQHSALPHLIKERKLTQIEDNIKQNRSKGMQAFDDHLYELVRNGTIAPNVAIPEARDPEGFKARLRRGADEAEE